MEEITFNVMKMGCGACVARVTAALNDVAGVEVLNVRLGRAVVRRDPAAVTDQQITEALRAAGYPATREADHARTV